MPTLRTLLVAILLAIGTSSGAARLAECKAACTTAIEGCIAWRSTTLRDADVSARKLRRKAKGIRRGCTKAALHACRTADATVCDVPAFCACGR